MTTPTSNTPSNPAPAGTPRPGFSLRNVLLVAVPAAVIAGLVYAYFSSQPLPSEEPDYSRLLAQYAERAEERTKLAAKYTDADGNLIADTPTEPAKLLNPDKLVFTGLIFDDPEKSRATWKDFMAHLSKTTGKPVEFAEELHGFEDQLTAMREGKLHVTGFNTGGVPIAVKTAGFVPMVAPANDKGEYAYRMLLVVAADSPIQKPEDLKPAKPEDRKVLVLTSMASNAGFKAPVVLLKEKFDLLLGRDLGFGLAGGYRVSLDGVAKKRPNSDVAAVASDYLERMIAQGNVKREELRTIYQSEEFPPLCFGSVYNLEPALAAKVREAFLTFPWADTSVGKEYKSAGQTKFVPIDYKKDWQLVRQIDEGMLRLAEKKDK